MDNESIKFYAILVIVFALCVAAFFYIAKHPEINQKRKENAAQIPPIIRYIIYIIVIIGVITSLYIKH